MPGLNGAVPAVQRSDDYLGFPGRKRLWPLALGGLTSLAVGGILMTMGAGGPGAALTLLGVSLAALCAFAPGPSRALPSAARNKAAFVERTCQGDPDLYLDLDAVEVHAVYQIGSELYTHLRGGIGLRIDPRTGDRRPIETSDVSLTWRCSGRRAAENLALQLNEWAARGTLLRLLAIRGRCALLIEDATRWVTLPELRLAA